MVHVDGRIVDGWRRACAIKQIIEENPEVSWESVIRTEIVDDEDAEPRVWGRHMAARSQTPRQRADWIIRMNDYRTTIGMEPRSLRQMAKDANVSHETIRKVQREQKAKAEPARVSRETKENHPSERKVENHPSDYVVETTSNKKEDHMVPEEHLIAVRDESDERLMKITDLEEELAAHKENPEQMEMFEKNSAIIKGYQSRIRILQKERDAARRELQLTRQQLKSLKKQYQKFEKEILKK